MSAFSRLLIVLVLSYVCSFLLFVLSGAAITRNMEIGLASLVLHVGAVVTWIVGPKLRQITWALLVLGRLAVMLAVWMPTTADLHMVPVPDSPVIVVTGGTKGIGLGFVDEVYSTLAHLNPRVIVLARSLPANSSISKDDFVAADFSSVAAVPDIAARLRERTDRVDLLVLNAGMGELDSEPRITSEGLSLSLAVNYVSQAILYKELAPMLDASPLNRMVLVTSIAHVGGSRSAVARPFDQPFEGLGTDAYSISKLQQVVFAKELAKRSSTHVTSVHPGCIASSIFERDGDDPRMFIPDLFGSRKYLAPLGPPIGYVAQKLMTLTWEPIAVGGRRVMWAALDNSTSSGDYVHNFGQLNSYMSPFAEDAELGAILMQHTDDVAKRFM
mmetsp:Transcript_599/g.1851  ORF Transcript_599/g.1851 Transcript_599/m.1851 type:complete len:386 (-) Transcript_599:107-1264(-)